VSGRAVLIYDGDCPLCRASALWLLRRAEAGGARDLELLPSRSPARRRRFPQVSDEACQRAMQLVLPDGRVLAGADAVPEILRRIPRWRWLAGVLAWPPVRPLSRRVYRWVADNRMRLSCALPRSSR
jgi:predicted DCC family thiol-disulfide oxidoreductase YuxK